MKELLSLSAHGALFLAVLYVAATDKLQPRSSRTRLLLGILLILALNLAVDVWDLRQPDELTGSTLVLAAALFVSGATLLFWFVRQRALLADDGMIGQRARQFADYMEDVFWTWGIEEQRFLYLNSASQSIYGISPNELLKNSGRLLETVHADDRAAVAEVIERQLRGEPTEQELRIVKDRQVVWLSVRTFPINNSQGVPYRVAGVSRDITAQKLAEKERESLMQQLADSESRFRTLAEAVPLIVWTAASDGVDYYNDGWSAFTGINTERGHNWGWQPVLHPDHEALTVEAWRAAVASGQQYQMEHKLKRFDGEYRWFLSRAVAQKNDRGEVVKWFGTATDITDVKQAEEALRESEERFRQLADTIPELFWVWDVRRQAYDFISAASVAILGLTPEVLMTYTRDKDLRQLVHPEDRDLVAALFTKQLAGQSTESEFRFLRDDTVTWVNARAIPLRNAEGQVCRIVGALTDITARKTMEQERSKLIEALKLEKMRLASVLTQMPAGVMVVEAPSGKIVSHNKKAEETLGHLGLEYPTARALQGEVVVGYEMDYERADGTLWNFCTDAAPIVNSNGDIVAAVVVFSDISERRKADKERERLIHDLQLAKDQADAASEAKSQFLANMSHEIRTPLSAILGFSELLKLPDTSPHDQQQFLDAIIRNGHNLVSLIDDILDLSKVEAGMLEIELVPVSLSGVLAEVQQLLSHQAEAKNIRLSFEIAAAGDVIATDPVRLRQILINIVGNAVKFTRVGSVTVKVQQQRRPGSDVGLLEFRVQDTGVGIEPQQQDRLFQPFTQADASTTRKFGGTGLGLVLSRRLAQLLGGSLELAESVAGQGSVFVIRIAARILERTVQGARATTPRTLTLQGLSVLLADDSVDNQLIAERILKRSGAQVDIATNGQEAIQKVASGRYDIILMDIQMPLMDGYKATDHLRTQGFEQPIVALTAHAMREERERCLRSGFSEHMSKPLNATHLVTKVAQLTGRL